MWKLTSENILFIHIFFLRRNFLCTSNSGLPYSFSEMVNIYMTVLEYHNFSCRHWDRNVVFYKRKRFASLILFFSFFRKKILCTSNPGFPYSFSERVWLRFNVPVNNFFSHVGTEPPLPGYYQYFLGGKCILLKDTSRRPG